MSETQLTNELDTLVNNIDYKVNKPTLILDDIYGRKLGYYSHAKNQIVIHEHFAENADAEEVMQTLKHELAHAIAEQNNTEKKAVWHGQAWKDVLVAIGGQPERYHQGDYKKPEHKKLSMQELYSIKPKHPADRWERGTYRQWLSRGYHVRKGEKGQFVTWEFVADEYETETDGKTSRYGRASATYFTNEQVEANDEKAN